MLISYLKFFVKIYVVRPVRAGLLFIFGSRVNKKDWEKRLLIINLEALGDLVVFSGALKHYKKRYPDKKIHLLIKSGTGFEELAGDLVDRITTVDYRQLSLNPWYGFGFISSLREVGFHKVINHDFSAAEINGKMLGADLLAEETITYEGMGFEYYRPFDLHQERNLSFIRSVLGRYKKIIPRLDRGLNLAKDLPSALRHYVQIYEGATGFKESDYAPALPFKKNEGRGRISAFGLSPEKYAVFNVSASVPYKRWPLERFRSLSRLLEEQGIRTVIIGAGQDKSVADRFKRLYPKALNLAGKSSMRDLVFLILHSKLVVTNDTSTVHFSVALNKPLLCMAGGGQFGMFTEYGYPDIHKWLYERSDCFGDNWRCGKGLEGPSPCLYKVATEKAETALKELLAYIEKQERPAASFSLGSEGVRVSEGRGEKQKLLYLGLQAENYNPKRKPSFEYNNFYLSLKAMPGVEVLEFPFDRILRVGRKKFNEDLLALVKNEKPDILFAFAYTDELDTGILDEIMNHTTSLVWFADDHWRIPNYSRHYAPHFTWAITTWSEAPSVYHKLGIVNVIRSQWACNPRIWRPVESKKTTDVSFFGQYNPARGEIVSALRKLGIEVKANGFGWPGGRISQEEMLRGISESKININLNTPPSRSWYKSFGRLLFRKSINKIVPSLANLIDNFRSWRNMSIRQIKARPFEILGSKAFLISDYADDMDTYYEDGKEIVYYDGTISDLAEKIRHYLGREKEREEIAAAAYKRTLGEHTYEQRFREIFAKIGFEVQYKS